jgi:short-subunit dehydrogenase
MSHPSGRRNALLGGLTNLGRGLHAAARRPPPLPPSARILVTGASTGIGLQVARRLLTSPHHLILTARADSLARFAAEGITPSERVWLRPLDVTDPAQRAAVIDEIEAAGGVDVLVNNAGLSFRSVSEHTADAERLAQLDVNFLGPLALSRLALPGMRARRRGRILNISSVGGMAAMPTMSAYSASKFALEGATEALWYEVRPWGVAVSLVQPGFIRSDGFRKVVLTAQGRAALADPSASYHLHYTAMSRLIENLMLLTWSTPDSVAKRVVRLIHHPDPPLRVAGTFDAALFALARRLLPRGLFHRLLYAGLPEVWRWGEEPPG